MDEDFELIISTLPALEPRIYPSPSQINYFEGKLPERLLSYWKKHGWSAFGQDLFWLLNPTDYGDMLQAWCSDLVDAEDVYVIGRSAFCSLITWKKGYGEFLRIDPLKKYDLYICSRKAYKRRQRGFFSWRFHKPPLKQYFKRYRPGSASDGCDDGSINIGDARFASGVYKIPADLAVAAVTEAKQRKSLARSLASYRDKSHLRGFDAALIVEVGAGEMRLTGISADASEKPYKSTLLLSTLEDPSKLRRALCSSLGALPVLDEP